MEDENKSNSSTAPPASTAVEGENNSTRRRHFRIQAFQYSSGTITVDPETVAKTCKEVTQAISEFYAQGELTTMVFEDLYRSAYNMILVYNKGEELYSAMEAAMTSEVQSLSTSLHASPADGAVFLKELLIKWDQHIKAVNLTRDILMYMERTFVPTNRKTLIKDLGLQLWRDHMVRSDKSREKLIEAVKQCSGDGSEDELVAGVNKMLTELGEDVPGLFFPDSELHAAGRPIDRVCEMRCGMPTKE